MPAIDLMVNVVCVSFKTYLTLGELLPQSASVLIQCMNLQKSL